MNSLAVFRMGVFPASRVLLGCEITDGGFESDRNEKSPGLKRGGVLNIVRRKVELKCPAENIPTELIVDLDGLDIGSSIKISSIKSAYKK